MTVKDILNKGTIMLKINKIENPKQKARLLLQYILKMTREQIIIYDTRQVKKEEEQLYLVNINKLIKGIPLQQITKTQEFMKMNFYVNENVLIPRADTEILVEEVIKIAKNKKNPVILDLCTGSGAIAVSIAKYVDTAKVYAIDISSKALEVAKKNAQNNGVASKIEFIESDLFAKIDKNIKFDMIASNPPYIKTKVIKTLNKDVQNEPIIALDGGEDGLTFYRKIIEKSYEYMKYDAYLCLEIGYDQKNEVIEIIDKQKNFVGTYCKKDLYDNDRVIVTRLGD